MAQDKERLERRILERLEAEGCSWREYFLYRAGDSVLICRLVKGNAITSLLIEDDALAGACRDFLSRHGAEQFSTLDELVRRFGWKYEWILPERKTTEPSAPLCPRCKGDGLQLVGGYLWDGLESYGSVQYFLCGCCSVRLRRDGGRWLDASQEEWEQNVTRR